MQSYLQHKTSIRLMYSEIKFETKKNRCSASFAQPQFATISLIGNFHSSFRRRWWRWRRRRQPTKCFKETFFRDKRCIDLESQFDLRLIVFVSAWRRWQNGRSQFCVKCSNSNEATVSTIMEIECIPFNKWNIHRRCLVEKWDCCMAVTFWFISSFNM